MDVPPPNKAAPALHTTAVSTTTPDATNVTRTDDAFAFVAMVAAAVFVAVFLNAID